MHTHLGSVTARSIQGAPALLLRSLLLRKFSVAQALRVLGSFPGGLCYKPQTQSVRPSPPPRCAHHQVSRPGCPWGHPLLGASDLQAGCLRGRVLQPLCSRSADLPPCPAGSRERHGPRTPGGQLSGARRGPSPRQPAPLPARPTDALRCILRPLRARPARRPCCPCLAAGRLPLRPHRPACRHRRPGGPPLAWGSPQPAPRPASGR